jgi:hypothetical protein
MTDEMLIKAFGQIVTDASTNRASSYNGWANWDTWEAYNLITSYEDIYRLAVSDSSYDSLEALLFDALDRSNADIEHIMFSLVDFDALTLAFSGE